MREPLDELYLRWLYSQVGNVKLKNPARTHWSLLRQLYKKEFIWLVPNDDNRLEDGRDLRMEFVHEEELTDLDPDWMELGCSFLEMLIGLARRLNFEEDQVSTPDWFWVLVDNLDLRDFNDKFGCPIAAVDEVLDDVIWRTYRPDGYGGLFPLKHAEEDQRDVEIWYQLSAYLIENY